MSSFVTKTLDDSRYDTLAPDGSEIRLLATGQQGSMAHVVLHPGQVSMAVAHHQVEEVWYILSGQGELWRKQGNLQEIVQLHAGVSVTISPQTHFQFRTIGSYDLKFILVTMPPWPGDNAAFRVQDYWPSSLSR